MITTVTLNPAVDKTIILESFVYASLNRAKSVRTDMGGKGINVAKVLNAMGADTCAVGFMGEDNFESVKRLLEKENLKSSFIMVQGQTRTNIKLLELCSRKTTDINEAGFPINTENITALKCLIQDYTGKSEYVVFSGSIPKGAPPTLYFELMECLPAGTRTVLDAEGQPLLEGMRAKPFLIKPNLFELESALNRKLETHTEIVRAAGQLIENYGIQYILLSMGADGSILVSREQSLFAKALHVDVKGTVGAGDSMLAGFLFGLSQRMSPKKSLAWATSCGALAVSREGTQTFDRSEAEALVGRVEIQELGV